MLDQNKNRNSIDEVKQCSATFTCNVHAANT